MVLRRCAHYTGIYSEKKGGFFVHSDVITHLAYMLYILPSLPSCHLNIPIHDFEKKSDKETIMPCQIDMATFHPLVNGDGALTKPRRDCVLGKEKAYF
jgi:hypothetical protein